MKNVFYPIAIYYCLIFASNGAYVSYIGLYYTDVGLDTMHIGVLTTVSAIVAILVQPFWGLAGDRARYKNHVLMICVLLTGVCSWLIPLSGSAFWLIVCSILLFTVFQCAVSPFSNTITLELAAQHNFTFSRVRTFGSVGYAVMSFVAGWLIGFHLYYIFVMYSLLMLLACAFTPWIPKVEGHQSQGKKVSFGKIFKNKSLVCLFIFSFFIQSTASFFFSFHAIYSQEQGIGTGLIGLGVMIGSISQFPFMIFFDRLYRKFGIFNILIFSGFLQGIRLLLYAFVLTPQTIVLLWILHGGTVILFTLCLAEYVNDHVEPELKASGQMMNAIVMQGLSIILGSFAGGVLAHYTGLQSGFVVGAAICIAAAAAFWIAVQRLDFLRERKREPMPVTKSL